VGRNSSIVIDSFVFNPDDTAREVSMSALTGAFRFISGISQKQAYAIRTPTSTIGVRGTELDLFVTPNGETAIALFSGEARVCDFAGNCVELTAGCSMAVSAPGAGVTNVSSNSERLSRLRSVFPYVVSQAGLRGDFRVDVSSCGLARASLPNDPAGDFEASRGSPD
jgi:hypothetical protein